MKAFAGMPARVLILTLALTLSQTAAAEGFECLLEPWQVVEVRAPVDGMIASISVQRGDTVRQGQPLAQLQSGVEQATLEVARFRAGMEAQVATARSRLEYTQRKLVRLTQMEKENFMSAQARDEAEAEKRLAEAELQSATESREMARLELVRAQEALALRTLVAPFNGVVVDRMLNPGDLAEAGSGRKAVLKVAQVDPIRADVPLPAALFGKVRVGSRAAVTAQVGGRRFEARVSQVDPVIDAASGTFVVRLEVRNAQGAVPAGSRCTAGIDGLAPPQRPRP